MEEVADRRTHTQSRAKGTRGKRVKESFAMTAKRRYAGEGTCPKAKATRIRPNKRAF